MSDHVRAMTAYDAHSAADLALECGVPRVELLEETTSTLDVAHQLAAGGALAGTVVLADVQTQGRGRLGRAWVSGAGDGVWCTVIERPGDVAALEVLSLRVGMRVAAALDALARDRVRLKWPNDLMLGAGKLGGILIESRLTGSAVAWVAIGVGINVRRPEVAGAAGFPEGVRRIDVLKPLVRAIRAAAGRTGPLSSLESAQWTNRDVLHHRRITTPGTGVVRGIDASGALIVETDHGTERHRAGTITLAEDS